MGGEAAPTLPQYDPVATCPKCGSSEVGTRYETDAHHANGHTHLGYECALAALPRPECCKAEHLSRRCQTCRYGWCESCLPVPEP